MNRPHTTLALTLVIVGVFILQYFMDPTRAAELTFALSVIPASVSGERVLDPSLALVPPEATLVTHTFFHAGWFHLLANVLTFIMFARPVEAAMGALRFLLFFLLCGACGAMTIVLLSPGLTIQLVGASGAISGVIAGFTLLLPKARLETILSPLIGSHPAWGVFAVLIGAHIAIIALIDPYWGGIAWLAHLGGAGAGLVFTPLLKARHVRLLRDLR